MGNLGKSKVCCLFKHGDDVFRATFSLRQKAAREGKKKLNKDYPTNLKRLDDFNQLNTVSEFFLVFKSG